MSELTIKIVSPQGLLFQGHCHMAVIPSTDGDAGIMRGHESMITSLRQGKILICDDKENVVKNFDVESGFAEINEDSKLIVLLNQ